MRDAASAATQLQYVAAAGKRRVKELGLAHGGQKPVHLDRAAVGSASFGCAHHRRPTTEESASGPAPPTPSTVNVPLVTGSYFAAHDSRLSQFWPGPVSVTEPSRCGGKGFN